MPYRLSLASLSLPVFFAFAGLVACSDDGEDATATPIVGVNDIAKACAIRVTWPLAGETGKCQTCKGYSTTPKCDCGNYDYAGKCEQQQKAVREDTSCDGVDQCISACKSDCGCVERCYEGRACKAKAAARDGCVAEVCEKECQ